MVMVNIDDKSLDFTNEHYLSEGNAFTGFIPFEMNKSLDSLVPEPDQAPVFHKQRTFRLDNFGSGLSGSSAVLDNLFRYIKIDRFLFWNFMSKPGGSQLMGTLLNFFSLNNCNVVVEIIETEQYQKW